jgi:chaperone required for assembly of F1-ATPase
MKRFWRNATVEPTGTSHSITLDGKPVRLPSGAPLTTPHAALAHEIAAEWGCAGETFTPDDLPLTRLASTAQERITPHRDTIISQLAAYGMNDLLCYRAETPEPLVAHQHERWTPWLDWAKAELGVDLLTTSGLMPIAQSPQTHEALVKILTSFTNDTLAALGVIVPALGSLVLGLAVTMEALDPLAACDLALLDELWQAGQWGEDSEADTRRAHVREDIVTTARFITLCRG